MFSDKLRELREQSGMKQEELAKKMYLSRPVISKWERGLQYPNVEQLKQLSHIFHISMDELMDNTDFMTMPEVQPIMETKEETNLELIIFSALLALYLIKLLFDLTVKYNPKTFDWLLEDIVFIPVLFYTVFMSYKKEIIPKISGFISIYLMTSSMVRSIYLYVDGVLKIGFHWIDLQFCLLHNIFLPLIYSAVILLFYREERDEEKKDRQNNLIYWALIAITVGYGIYVSVLHTRGYFTELFGWNEHYIYMAISYISRMLLVIVMLTESTKLRKKRIQARMSVSE